MADYSGLLELLQQPQTMALAQGLLQGSQPSMEGPVTFGGALGQGLQAYNASDLKQKGLQAEEKRFKKQFGLQENAQKLKAKEMADKIRANQRAVEQEAARNTAIRGALSGENPGLLNNLSDKQKQGLLVMAQFAPDKVPGMLSSILMKEEDIAGKEKKIAETDKIRSDINKQQKELLAQEKQQQQQQEMISKALGGEKIYANESDEDAEVRTQKALTEFQSGNTEAALKTLAEKPKEDLSKKPTQAVLTRNQNAIQAIDSAVKQIKELKKSDIPFQLGTVSVPILGSGQPSKLFSPERQEAYKAKKGGIIENLITANQLSGTEHAFKIVGPMVEKGAFERDKAYHKRLDDLVKDLESKKEKALKITNLGAKGKKSKPSNEDPLGIL